MGLAATTKLVEGRGLRVDSPTSECLTPDEFLRYDGTAEEVAAFFGYSVKQVRRWTTAAKGKPELDHWQDGRRVKILESSIIAKFVKGFRATHGLAPGEAAKIGEREWRAFKCLRTAMVADPLEARLARIEAQLGIITKEAA